MCREAKHARKIWSIYTSNRSVSLSTRAGYKKINVPTHWVIWFRKHPSTASAYLRGKTARRDPKRLWIQGFALCCVPGEWVFVWVVMLVIGAMNGVIFCAGKKHYRVEFVYWTDVQWWIALRWSLYLFCDGEQHDRCDWHNLENDPVSEMAPLERILIVQHNPSIHPLGCVMRVKKLIIMLEIRGKNFGC